MNCTLQSGRASWRQFAAGLLLLSASLSQAEMVSGVVHFQARNPPEFSISARYDNIGTDSSISFRQSYGPTKSFFSLLRFERQIKPVNATVPFDGRLYLVNKGDVVTAQTVEAGQFRLLNTANGRDFKDIQPVTVGREFWLLVAIRKTPASSSAPPVFKSFSWARMKFNVWNQLEMLDSITAYEEPGLIVGQKTPCQAQACQDAAAALPP